MAFFSFDIWISRAGPAAPTITRTVAVMEHGQPHYVTPFVADTHLVLLIGSYLGMLSVFLLYAALKKWSHVDVFAHTNVRPLSRVNQWLRNIRRTGLNGKRH